MCVSDGAFGSLKLGSAKERRGENGRTNEYLEGRVATSICHEVGVCGAGGGGGE